MAGKYLAGAVLVAVLVAAVAGREDVPLTDHSFYPPFKTGTGRADIPNWNYGFDSVLSRDALTLTPPFEEKLGFVYNEKPVKNLHWAVEIQFSVSGSTEITDSEGLAFWYVDQPHKIVASSNETRGYFSGIGVFFDTFDDHLQINNSFVWTMTNDGTKEYGHQHAEYDDEDEPAACIMDFRNRPLVTARISYVDRTLQVSLDLESNDDFTNCFTIHDIDLPRGLHYGLSSSTGKFEDSYSLYSFRTFERSGTDRDADVAPGHHLQGAIEPPHISSVKEITKPLEVEIEQLKDEVNRLQAELSSARHDKHSLEMQLQEEKTRRAHLEKTADLHRAEGSSEGGDSSTIVKQLESLLNTHLEKDLENQRASMDAYERVFKYEEELDAKRRNFQDEATRSLSTLHQELRETHEMINHIAKNLGNAVENVGSGNGGGGGHHIKSLEDKLMAKLLKHTEHLNVLHDTVSDIKHAKGGSLPPMGPQLEEFQKEFKQMKEHVERSKKQQEELADTVRVSHQKISESIETHGRIGFWTYFLFIQVAFGLGYIFYAKYREEKKSHLF